MTNLTAAYALPDQIGSRYFLRLEQVGVASVPVDAAGIGLPEDVATIGEGAWLLDTLYDRNPCEDDQTGGEEAPADENGILEPPVDEDEFWEIVRGGLDFAICDEDGFDLLKIKVYRSHLSEPYKLVFDNGEQRQVVVQNEEKKEVVSVAGEMYADLLYPVHNNFRYSWSSARGASGESINPPSVEPDGARVVFPMAVTGVLRCQYGTMHDLVTVAVPRNEDGNPGECHVQALYAGDIYELDLKPVEIDKEMDSVARKLACGGGGGTVDVPDKPYSCYELIYHRVLCFCSGKDSGKGFYTEEDVSCPDWWGDDVGEGRHLLGSRSVLHATVRCPGEGGKYTAQDHLDICCVTGSPPLCDSVIDVFRGGLSYDPAAAKAEYGKDVILVPIGPPDGICGKHTTDFKKPNLNCCDDVEPLEIDVENTDWSIDFPGSADVAATGGRAPFYWKVNGGYHFENGLDEDVTGGATNRILTDEDGVCGDAVVQLHDDCSRVSFRITQTQQVVDPELPENMVMNPGSQMVVTLDVPTVGPYQWSAAGELSWLYDETDTPSNILKSTEDFCGTEVVSVSDACGNFDSVDVRSTEGHWEQVPESQYDRYFPPGMPYELDSVGPPLVGIKGRYKAEIASQGLTGQDGSENPPCPDSIYPIGGARFFEDYDPDAVWCTREEVAGDNPNYDAVDYEGGGCCFISYSSPTTSYVSRVTGLYFTNVLWEWVC